MTVPGERLLPAAWQHRQARADGAAAGADRSIFGGGFAFRCPLTALIPPSPGAAKAVFTAR